MESFDGCSAVSEARGLFRMLTAGSTIEELRELIAVPLKTERVLRAYAWMHPEEVHFIETGLKFRLSIAREFERLVREEHLAVEVCRLARDARYNCSPTVAHTETVGQ